MIYAVIKSTNRWTTAEIMEFQTEKEAIEGLQNIPRTRIVGVFKGDRLNFKVGEKKVVKKTVIGFEPFEETEE